MNFICFIFSSLQLVIIALGAGPSQREDVGKLTRRIRSELEHTKTDSLLSQYGHALLATDAALQEDGVDSKHRDPSWLCGSALCGIAEKSTVASKFHSWVCGEAGLKACKQKAAGLYNKRDHNEQTQTHPVALDTVHKRHEKVAWKLPEGYLNGLRMGCGELCNMKGPKLLNGDQYSKYFDFVGKRVDCTDLFKGTAVEHLATALGDPVAFPQELRHAFAMNGKADVRVGKIEYQPPPSIEWTQEFVELVVEKYRKGDYSHEDESLVNERTTVHKFFKQHADHIINKSILVLGTTTPWLEAMFLATGASHVVSVHGGEARCFHPRLTCMTSSEYRRKFLPTAALNGVLPRFDTVASFSSLASAGLGIHAEALNPWADQQEVARAWCTTKPGGALFLGVPSGSRDELNYREFNAGRVYGPTRLPQLVANWEQLDKVGPLWGMGDNQATGMSMPLLMFRRVDVSDLQFAGVSKKGTGGSDRTVHVGFDASSASTSPGQRQSANSANIAAPAAPAVAGKALVRVPSTEGAIAKDTRSVVATQRVSLVPTGAASHEARSVPETARVPQTQLPANHKLAEGPAPAISQKLRFFPVITSDPQVSPPAAHAPVGDSASPKSAPSQDTGKTQATGDKTNLPSPAAAPAQPTDASKQKSAQSSPVPVPAEVTSPEVPAEVTGDAKPASAAAGETARQTSVQSSSSDIDPSLAPAPPIPPAPPLPTPGAAGKSVTANTPTTSKGSNNAAGWAKSDSGSASDSAGQHQASVGIDQASASKSADTKVPDATSAPVTPSETKLATSQMSTPAVGEAPSETASSSAGVDRASAGVDHASAGGAQQPAGTNQASVRADQTSSGKPVESRPVDGTPKALTTGQSTPTTNQVSNPAVGEASTERASSSAGVDKASVGANHASAGGDQQPAGINQAPARADQTSDGKPADSQPADGTSQAVTPGQSTPSTNQVSNPAMDGAASMRGPSPTGVNKASVPADKTSAGKSAESRPADATSEPVSSGESKPSVSHDSNAAVSGSQSEKSAASAGLDKASAGNSLESRPLDPKGNPLTSGENKPSTSQDSNAAVSGPQADRASPSASVGQSPAGVDRAALGGDQQLAGVQASARSDESSARKSTESQPADTTSGPAATGESKPSTNGGDLESPRVNQPSSRADDVSAEKSAGPRPFDATSGSMTPGENIAATNPVSNVAVGGTASTMASALAGRDQASAGDSAGAGALDVQTSPSLSESVSPHGKISTDASTRTRQSYAAPLAATEIRRNPRDLMRGPVDAEPLLAS